MALFSSAPDAAKGLCRIADLLFRQSQMFGQLSIDRAVSRGQVHHAIIRTNAVAFLLQVLETTADLRFGSIPFPFCYNRASWAKEQPAGGYTSASSAPLPSDALKSLVAAWNLPKSGLGTINYSAADRELTSTTERSSLVERLIRSALAVVATRGFSDGLEYMFDLLKAGYVIDTGPFVDALSVLLVARSQATSDAEMTKRFFGGTLPASNAELIDADICYDHLKIESLSGHWESESRALLDMVAFQIDHDTLTTFLGGLLETTLREVNCVRSSDSYDEWLIGQITLAGRITAVISVITKLARTLPLGAQAVLSQFKEIRADVGAMTLNLSDHYGVPSYFDEGSIGFVAYIAGQYRRTVGTDWADRLFAERLLIPEALRSALLPDLVVRDKPLEWDALTWMIARPFCLALGQQEAVVVSSAESETSIRLETLTEPQLPAYLSRTTVFDGDRVLRIDAVRQWVQQFGPASEAEQKVFLRQVMATKKALRAHSESGDWVDFLTALSLGRAHSGDFSRATHIVADLDPARVEALDGNVVVERPGAAVSLNDYKLLLNGELFGELELAMRANEEGRRAEAIEALQLLRYTYPWAATVYQELSIATDESGDPEAALELIIRALVLDPRQSLLWHSLGVILERIGARRESAITMAISVSTRQIENKYQLA
jgi:hypothetical protein